MTNQASTLLKYYQYDKKFFDLASYLNSLTLKPIFISEIKSSQYIDSFPSNPYKLYSSLTVQNTYSQNELWKNSFQLLSEVAYQKNDNELNSFIKMCLNQKSIPVWAYTNICPQGCILEIDFSYLENSLLSAQKELIDQRLWAEWGKNSQNVSGLVNLIQREGIYIQSPQWQYEKSLNALLEAIWSKDIIISLSPKTYYDIFKRKLYHTISSFPYKDTYEWKGEWININISSGIPEKIIIVASPQTFIRKTIEPLKIKKEERTENFKIEGHFELSITEKNTSGIIQLIT